MPSSQILQGNFANSARNPYDDFVSPNSTPGQTSAYQKRRFDTQNLPDGVDRSLMIRDSTEELMWQFLQTWQLSQVFPWQTVEVLELTLQYFEALPTFFSVTPEQAVGHMLTQRETTHKVSLVRYSLQARLEWGFLGTNKGQRRYRAMLQQFSISMIETAHADVYRALLQAHDPQQIWLMRHGELHVEELQSYLKWDHFVFGALQKMRDNPLEKIDAKVKTLMTKYRGVADTYIIGEEMEVYAQMVPLRKTRYNLGGQEAVDRINGTLKTGGDSNTPTPLTHVDPIRMVNGSQVFVARSFVVEGEGDVDPFKRFRQFGEWNILQDNIKSGRYDNARRSILIYNQTKDVMSPVSLKDCIMNCHMWDSDGSVESFSSLGLDPSLDPDAQYDPFVMETNSYDSVKFIGDLGHDYLDITTLKKAAKTIIEAMFEDESDRLKDVMGDLDIAMNEMRARLAGEGTKTIKEGDNFVTYPAPYEVTWDDLENNGKKAFSTIANRLRSVASGSIFLDPRSGKGSPGQLLFDTIIKGGSVPVWKTDSTDSVDAKTALLQTLTQLSTNGSLTGKLQDIADGQKEFPQKVELMRDLIRRDINSTRFSEQGVVAFNTYLQNQMREFRALGLEGKAAFTGKPDGYVSPSALKGLKEGWATQYSQETGAGRQQRAFREELGREEEEDIFNQIPVNGDFPSTLWHIPFVSGMIASSTERMGSTSDRRRVLNEYDEFDLGGLSSPIGREVDLGQRRADLGYMPLAFRQLGFANYSPSELRIRLGTMAKHVEHIARSGMSALRKILALIYIGLPFTKEQLLTLDNNNILVPVNFIVARCHAQVETQIIAKCQSGGGSGFTYYAFSNVAVGDNVLTKTHTINFHFHLRAFVHKPRNVFIIPDVFVTGYDGGLGVGFHSPATYLNGSEVTLDRPSIICLMVDYNTRRDDMPNPFDITGHWNAGIKFRGIVGQDRPHYPTAARVRRKFGVGRLNGTAGMPVLHEAHQNTYMYRGHTEEDNGSGKIVVRPNTGHWGPDVYAGCKRVREGELYELRDMAYGTGRA